MPCSDQHHNLPPTAAAGVVGRSQELARITSLLSRSPLVCLTGVGGVGKTRLALGVAWRAQRTFDDLWLIDSTQLPDGGSLADLVAATLGVDDQPGRAAVDGLVEHIADRSVLLVLDTCEHIVDDVSRLAFMLLRSCPRLRILATSREALRVTGEVTLSIPPLALPDARPVPVRALAQVPSVALFVQRMSAAITDFRLTPDNAYAVAELCRRGDGLPLAIEVTAAMLARGTLSITAPLPDVASWLTASVPGPVPRHRSLHACSEWSYRLCSSAERLLWARLAVFRDAPDVDDVQAVCAGGPLREEDLLNLLAALVDKSVLIREERDGTARYRMLDTVRAFGAEQLRDLGEDDDVRRRHGDWFRQVVMDAAAGWAGPAQAYWLARLDGRPADIRAAMEFSLNRPGRAAIALEMAAGMVPYWLARGLPDESHHWLERALIHETEPGFRPADALQHRALLAAAVLAVHRGDQAGARALAEQAQPTEPDGADDGLDATRERVAGLISILEADLAGARRQLQQAVDLDRARGNRIGQVESMEGLSVASGLAGDLGEAVAAHQLTCALVADRTPPDRVTSTFVATSTWALSLAQWRHHAGQEARRTAGEAVRLAHGLHYVPGIVRGLEVLAWIAAADHRHARAAVLLGSAAGLAPGVAAPSVVFPDLLADHEQCEEASRRALGDVAFGAALRSGSELDVAAAVHFALDERTEPWPSSRAEARPAVDRSGTSQQKLTRREREVAELIGQGLTNREIASRLVIAQRTAEGHVESILAKLGVTSRTQVALWLTRHRSSPDG